MAKPKKGVSRTPRLPARQRVMDVVDSAQSGRDTAKLSRMRNAQSTDNSQ